MWELDYKESWVLKNWCFELWCWRRLLRVPWTARRSNQPILKEISPGCSLEGWCWSWNSNTLATWCEELTHLKRPWCWEKSIFPSQEEKGTTEDEDNSWMASLTRGAEFEQALGVGDGQGSLACCSPWGGKESDMTEQLNWTENQATCTCLTSSFCN